MVGEAVIVLDQIDPRPREGAAVRRELGGPEPHRLERGGQQRTAGHTGELAQAGDPRARAWQPVEGCVGEFHVGEEHIRLERAVAEQNGEELRRIASGGGERLRDGDAVKARTRGVDLHHAAEDVGRHPGIARRRVAGQLDRLLQQQCLGARGHVPRGGADEIGDVEAGVAGVAAHG